MPIKSFAVALGLDAFPLRCSEDHDKLIESTTEILRTFYHCVGVPAPAPDKEMYRDIHFIVAGPMGSIQPEQIRLALRSQLMDADGSRIYHFAVPIQTTNQFVHVSVENCTSANEYHRIMCFRAYGDLGMILNLLARTHGISLGCKGLKIYSAQVDGTYPTSVLLSSSFYAALGFMGLSETHWRNGFRNKAALYAWIETSRFYIPAAIRDTSFTFNVKNIEKRKLYNDFLERVKSQIELHSTRYEIPSQVEAALHYFDKKMEYDRIVKKTQRDQDHRVDRIA